MNVRAINLLGICLSLAAVLVMSGCAPAESAQEPSMDQQSELLQPAEQASDAAGIANDAIDQQQQEIEQLDPE